MNKGLYGFGLPPNMATRVAPPEWRNAKLITATTSSEVVPLNVYQIGVAVFGGGGSGGATPATTAYGVYSIGGLAEYEAYRARLAADPLGRQNYRFAREKRFILKEDRIFLKLASAPHGERIAP